jgi:hypothetical protein
MTRTGWAGTAALVIAACSLGVAAARRSSLGEGIDGPLGRGAWKVSVVAAGRFTERDASLTVHLPPDFRRQHLVDVQPQASGVVLRGTRTRASRTEAVWDPAGVAPGKPQPFRLAYSVRCILGLRRPTPAMTRATRQLDSPPGQGDYLAPSARVQSDAEPVRRLARQLAEDGAAPADLVRALYEHVAELPDEPAPEPLSALDCLRQGSGDSGGKSRLLVALCRNRGVPARLLTGLILGGNREQGPHHWAEAWVGHWLPLDPVYRRSGARQFPANYLVLHLGDEDVFQAQGGHAQWGVAAQELTHLSAPGQPPPSAMAAFWARLSLFNLRPPEQQLVRFLLLLPLAALIVCVYRTVIGVPTFGTFAPALLGLAFLDLRALPWGLGIFVATVLAGWLLRRLLGRFHLLQIPRVAALLTLIVLLLIGAVLAASHAGVAATRYISLFPLVILTHLVERFWTIEEEDSTAASFRTLMGTLLVAVTVSLALAHPAVTAWLFRYPETLGLALAAQFLLGRYTGYRLTELYRFADLIQPECRMQDEECRMEEKKKELLLPPLLLLILHSVGGVAA